MYCRRLGRRPGAPGPRPPTARRRRRRRLSRARPGNYIREGVPWRDGLFFFVDSPMMDDGPRLHGTPALRRPLYIAGEYKYSRGRAQFDGPRTSKIPGNNPRLRGSRHTQPGSRDCSHYFLLFTSSELGGGLMCWPSIFKRRAHLTVIHRRDVYKNKKKTMLEVKYIYLFFEVAKYSNL